MKKLKSILLVDDDSSTNFLHQLILENAGCAEQLHFAFNGKEAIEFLQQQHQTQSLLPELILLDINMPVMNGWEFLDELHKLPQAIQQAVTVVMLTTSMNPDDEEKAKSIHSVKAFRNKPVSAAMIKELTDAYLNN